VLADHPDNINIGKVLAALGGRLYDSSFCNKHTGTDNICTHSVDCTMRSIWTSLQNAIDEILGNLTLGDLLKKNEHALSDHLHEISENILSQHPS
jgi:DNA-binding IscR family transcriptional regulator